MNFAHGYSTSFCYVQVAVNIYLEYVKKETHKRTTGGSDSHWVHCMLVHKNAICANTNNKMFN